MGSAMSGVRNGGEMRMVPASTRRVRSRRLMIGFGTGPIVLGVLAVAVPTELAASAAAAPASIASPSSAKPSALKYTVVNGDYLWGIAIKLGVKFVDLLTVNSFTMDTVIVPGQSVVVPEGGSLPPAAPAAGANTAADAAANTAAATATGPYVVVSGDSLSGIAQRMGVSLPALLKANTLKVDSVIHPGTKLSVPTGGHMPAPKSTTLGAIDGAAATGQPVAANRVNDAATVPPDVAASTTPAAGTAAAGQAALPAGYTSYTIAAGDYLVGIATKNGVTLKALLAANNLITTSAIQPGQQLSVPPATLPIPPAAPEAAATTTDSSGSATPSASQQSIATMVAFLEAQVGKPYAFNTEGPDTFDCSGLVTAAYRQIGVSLPHQSLLQSTKGTAVDWTTQPLLPGDLIFMFSTANPTVISHVGIVIDSSRWIQAGGSPTSVKIGQLPNASKIQAVRRIVQP